MAEDYTAYAGDTLQIVVEVTDEAGDPLDLTGAALIYVLRSRATGAEVVRKTSAAGEITVSGDTATIAIDAGDTTALGGGGGLRCGRVRGDQAAGGIGHMAALVQRVESGC